jgi:tetratricopeptide (TPR) repeat protein
MTVCFSPDGTRLASASDDRTVKVWDSTTGQELLTLRGHAHTVAAACFSPDGTRLASASSDSTVKIWESLPVSAEVLRKRALIEKVEVLFSRHLLKELVTQELRLDPKLNEIDHLLALQVADSHADNNPDQLNSAAWMVVRAPGGKKEAYALALLQAKAAVQAVPGNGNFLNSLGIAHYRLGHYAEALRTLMQSEKLNATKEGLHPVDLAVLAMAQHQLGEKDKARETLSRLREVMNLVGWAKNPEAKGFLSEAAMLIEGK